MSRRYALDERASRRRHPGAGKGGVLGRLRHPVALRERGARFARWDHDRSPEPRHHSSSYLRRYMTVARATSHHQRGGKRMPTYMDIHDIPGVKTEDVAGAHEQDLKVQGKYGVDYK